jgi:hypothetical protein
MAKKKTAGVAATGDTVEISRRGSDTVVRLNGEEIVGCTGFKVSGFGGQPTKVVLEITAAAVEVAGDFPVEQAPAR